MTLPELKQLPTQEEVDALKAQVNRFKHGVESFNKTGSMNELLSAYIETPKQCLAEVKAKAVEDYKKNKPKSEPVGYAWVVNNKVKVIADTELDSNFRPLYTTPPTREPLSEDEVKSITESNLPNGTLLDLVRSVEHVHKIGVKQ